MADLRNVRGYSVVLDDGSRTPSRNIRGYSAVLVDPEFGPARHLRAYATVLQPFPNGLFGNGMVYKEATATLNAHLDISGLVFTEIPADLDGVLHTLFTLGADNTFTVEEVTVQAGKWNVPVSGQISKLALLKGAKSQTQRDEVKDWMLFGLPLLAVLLDETRVPSGYALSEDGLTVVNTSGGGDYRKWVPAKKAMLPSVTGKVYWEVAFQATQTGSVNGYNAVQLVSILDSAFEGYDAGDNPGQANGSIAYRGNGEVWADSNRISTSPSTYGDGDVLMFAFEPSTGGMWVGKNGVWNRDPDTQSADYTTPYSDPAGWVPVIQGRDQGDGGTLRSSPDQFSYTVPASATAYKDI